MYTTATKPRLELTLGPGWRVVNPDVLALGDDPQVGPLLGVIEPPRVIDPAYRATGATVPEKHLLPTPDDFAGWIARHPRNSSDEPDTVSIGGRDVRRAELDITSGYRSRACPDRCVVLFAFGPKQYGFLAEGTRGRVYVTRGQSGPVAIGVFGTAGADFAPAERVLQRARFVD